LWRPLPARSRAAAEDVSARTNRPGALFAGPDQQHRRWLAAAAGGRIEDTLPNAAAWVPVSITTPKDGSKGVMPHFIDCAKPGVIAVTRGHALCH